ncbi:MAG: metal-sulfur cluster assembly factor [Mesorhizobium sp.]|nr:metal-sulfur cluster assembly factor [Mesorhizobium sp.]MBN9244719.1 metal-sulfur cluster assembly factor [Mesorhizobium sp.]
MSTQDTKALADAIRRALGLVIDPELGENVVDLGLIYDIAIAEGAVALVQMTTTTRGCPASAYLEDAVRAAAGSVPGIGRAEVFMTYEPKWTPDKMNDEARRRLGLIDRRTA